MRLRGVRLFALGAVFLAASHAAAQAPRDPSGTSDPAASPPAPATAAPQRIDLPREPLRMTLREAIESGIEKGLALQVQRFSPLAAAEAERIALGAFDPVIGSNLGYESVQTPTASSLLRTTIQERTTDGEAGVGGLLPLLGTTYDIGYAGQRLLTTSNLSTLSPELRSSLIGSVTQPLLRNFLWSEPWTAVKTSALQSSIAREGFRQSLMDVVRQIEDGYWALIALAEAQRVAEKSVATAKALLEQVQTQYEVGVVSRVEVTEAEAGLAAREFALIQARNTYLGAQDRFANLVLGTDFQAGSRFEIIPADDPGAAKPMPVDPELAVQKAFDTRPELAIARETAEQREVELKFAKNQRLPQFDVVGTYGYTGLNGSVNPNCTNFRNPGAPCESIYSSRKFYSSSEQFFNSRGALQWSARGVFSIPIPNTSARAAVSRSEIELRRAFTDVKRAEQDIILDVRDSIRNLQSQYEGTLAAEQSRVAAEEQLRAERIRLEQGESTPFDVLQREEQLVSSERDQIEALYRYRSAATGLDRAQGTILDSHRIVVEEASALR